MEYSLIRIRDKIIKDGYEANKTIPKYLVVKALQMKLSVPTIYRIINIFPDKGREGDKKLTKK